ncbi:MAG: AAA-like domain-containing protein [Lachnospiraceae bacterium]|nr:AAA-like domain-containing protein [Lachnospiraceae bacterium]
MQRHFNTEGQCESDIHYMVRLDDRLKQIKEAYVDAGKYFAINRGRQYGKTTTLFALEEYLRADYLVVHLDFQELSSAEFRDEFIFARAFAEIFLEAFENIDVENMEEVTSPITSLLKEAEAFSLRKLFTQISAICKNAPRPIVMMIDEVDSAGNNQVFIDFLALLRRYYLDRRRKAIFRSVILAGVYDIKNLKKKLRPEEEHQYNSPWNISAEFDVKMEFSAEQIQAMLQEYEEDNQTGMNVETTAGEIYGYTAGYPYLVSAICKLLDEKLPNMEGFADKRKIWAREGITEAVKMILNARMPLFDSMTKQLDTYKDLRGVIREMLYQGKRIPFSPAEESISLGLMFGFLKAEEGQIIVANRIFEMWLMNMFIAEEAVKSEAFWQGECDRNQFVKNKKLDMDLVLTKFVAYFNEIYGEKDAKFVEEYGRKFFLLYLKPIINGTGNYYMEAQTRDAKRTDVIVDYLGEQFIVELKIWHGSEYNERGEQQLVEYLEYYHKEKGYMLSFNFNQKKEVGVKEIKVGCKTIVEAVV